MINEGWQYMLPGYDDTWQDYDSKAWGADDVATEIGEEFYNEDPSDPSRFEIIVCVRQGKAGIVNRFKVTAEATVNFYAWAVKA